MDRVRSASVGIYLDAGSRHEREDECGVTHFIEHMLFKGTTRRSAYELSMEQNLLGGQVNAYTSQEHIVLSARVVDRDLPRALDLLVEMLTESIYDPTEFERERGVILEEYKMYEDTPDELVMDLFMSGLFDGHALGKPILGTPAHLLKFTPQTLHGYRGRMFTPDRMVVAAAGAVEAPEFLTLVEERLSLLQPDVPSSASIRPASPAPAYHHRLLDRELEQTHFVLGTVGPSRHDDSRFAFAVMSTILGAGPGSRIFQEVREKRGLAYSVGTVEWYFQDTGCFAISGGTSPDTYEQVEELCLKEVRTLATDHPTGLELECAKAQIRTGLVLGAESSSGRLARLAEQELWYGRIIPIEESLARLERVTVSDVTEAARFWLLDKPLAAAIIGESPRPPARERF
jgi:predicted Zn-dependent peptidase